MKLSEKIVLLRKDNNLTQEELAEMLNISRQSISKWESGLSQPDYDNLILISNYFNVTTDYLLKEDYEKSDNESTSKKSDEFKLPLVTLEEIEEFFKATKRSSNLVSLGVMLCILSPISLFVMLDLSNFYTNNVSITFVGIGIVFILMIVSTAVGLFIYNDKKLSKFNYIKSKPFYLTESTESYIVEERNNQSKKRTIQNIIGIIICILSTAPIILGSTMSANSEFNFYFVSLTLILISIGVGLIVKNNIIQDSFNELLQIGDFTVERKRIKPSIDLATKIYWLGLTAVYLLESFLFENWEKSWIIFPVGGVIFAAFINLLTEYLLKKEGQNEPD